MARVEFFQLRTYSLLSQLSATVTMSVPDSSLDLTPLGTWAPDCVRDSLFDTCRAADVRKCLMSA